jgi:hypothetical protein
MYVRSISQVLGMLGAAAAQAALALVPAGRRAQQ